MDGKGSYRDNLFIERLWRTVKYEEVYLKAYQNGKDAREKIEEWSREYNEWRPHSSLLLSSDYVSLIVQRFCQYPLIKIGSKFPFPGMTG